MQNLRPIPGWDGYEISETGKVWSFKRTHPTIKCARPDKDGYIRVGLSRPGATTQNVGVHRLLMLAFRHRPGCEALHVDHINGKRDDNRLENLRWCSVEENNRFTREGGRYRPRAPALTQDQIRWIQANHIPKDPHTGFYALARRFGVSLNTVRRSYRGTTRANQDPKEPK